MREFVILYDIPFESCNKIWLYEELKKYGQVKIINTHTKKSYFRISRIFPKLKIGKILVRLLIIRQVLRGILHSNKNSIIVTWSNLQGIYMNNICRLFKVNRKIISFNWIDLNVMKYKRRVKKCFLNPYFMPIINDQNLENKYMKACNLKQWYGLFLPDIYDNRIEFQNPQFKKEKKYFFAGGLNNRDWDTLINAARELTNVKFVIVAGKGVLKGRKLPENISFYEEIEAEKYYILMKKSYATICPLKEDRVSGLINIIKSFQYGLLCISARMSVTEMYYPEEYRTGNLLYGRSSIADLKKSIIEIWNMPEKEYMNTIKNLQTYLKNNFNSEKIVKDLIKKIDEKKW